MTTNYDDDGEHDDVDDDGDENAYGDGVEDDGNDDDHGGDADVVITARENDCN